MRPKQADPSSAVAGLQGTFSGSMELEWRPLSRMQSTDGKNKGQLGVLLW